jgi:hypothetical protein
MPKRKCGGLSDTYKNASQYHLHPNSEVMPNGLWKHAADANLRQQSLRPGCPAGADDRRASRPDDSPGGHPVDLAVGAGASHPLDRADRRTAPGRTLARAAGPETGTGRECGPSGGDSRSPLDRGMEREGAGGLLPGSPRGDPDRRGAVRETLRRRGPQRAVSQRKGSLRALPGAREDGAG